MQIIGDRTKSNQVGIALLRPYAMYMQNIGVNGCGNDGILLRQALMCEFHNIECMKNVGNGIHFQDGTVSWTDTTPTNIPANANIIHNMHCAFNDKAGIKHSSLSGSQGINGNMYHGGACEYNYYSATGTGYNIELNDVNFMPCEFMDMWCEGSVKSHIYLNMIDVSSTIRFTRLHHFGGGASSSPDRAIINDKGTVVLESPFGHATQYKNITGSGGTSKAPFRVNKAGAAALYFVNNAKGSLITDNKFVEDENQTTTGLQNQLPYANNFGDFIGGNGPKFTVGFGYGFPAIYQEGQSYPQVNFRTWDAINGSKGGWAFGGGIVAPDTYLIRYSTGVLGMGIGNSFQLDGATGATIKYTNGVSNNTVATTLGSVGPTGSTAGNPQGWLRINVSGTDRYIPYW